jgi:hypothetical protein
MAAKHTETNMNHLIAPKGNFGITSATQGGRRSAPAMPGRQNKSVPVMMSRTDKPGRAVTTTGTYGWTLSRGSLGIPAAGPAPAKGGR